MTAKRRSPRLGIDAFSFLTPRLSGIPRLLAWPLAPTPTKCSTTGPCLMHCSLSLVQSLQESHRRLWSIRPSVGGIQRYLWCAAHLNPAATYRRLFYHLERPVRAVLAASSRGNGVDIFLRRVSWPGDVDVDLDAILRSPVSSAADVR